MNFLLSIFPCSLIFSILFYGSTAICPFDSYNENYLDQSQEENCAKRENLIISRVVIIAGADYNKEDLSNFYDFIYSSLLVAFQNETFICSKYFYCNLKIYLLNITYNLSIVNNPNSFFQRLQGNISIEPMLCSMHPISGCLISYSQIKINIVSMDFTLYISDQFYWTYATFSFSLNAIQTENIALTTLFVFEAMVDSNLSNMPKIFLKNIEVLDFSLNYTNSNNNMDGASIYFLANYGYGNIHLEDVTFLNCSYPSGTVFFYQNQSGYLSFYHENNPLLISFVNIQMKNFLITERLSNTMQPIFYISQWNGFFNIKNFYWGNTSLTNNESSYIFYFNSILNPSNLENIYIESSENYGVIELNGAAFLLFANLTIRNCSFLKPAIVINEISSSLQFYDFKMKNCAFKDNLNYFLINQGYLNISDFMFENLLDCQFRNLNSIIILMNGTLDNIISQSRIFIVENSVIITESVVISNVYISISIFLLYNRDLIEINKVGFINITGKSCLIEFQKINQNVLNDVLFKKIDCPYFFSPTPQIAILIFRKVYIDTIQTYRILHIPTKLTCDFEDVYLGSLWSLTWTSRSYIFQFMKSLLYWNKIFFENIYGSINPFSFFHLSGGYIHINNSAFVNIGNINNDTSYFYSVDDNAALYFFNEQQVTVDSCFFFSINVSLHSGFIMFTGITGEFALSNSFFKHMLHPDFFSMGVSLVKPKKAVLFNNYFENLICSLSSNFRFSSYQRSNGAISVLGEEFYAKKQNTRVFTGDSNVFINCRCTNGGSLAIVNFWEINLKNCSFINSTALLNGGAFILVSSNQVTIANIYISNTTSYFSSIGLLMNIDKIIISNSTFLRTFASFDGCFETKNTKNLTFQNVKAENISTDGKGAFIYLKGESLYFQNISIFNAISREGGVVFIVENGNLYAFDSVFISCMTTHSGGFLYVESGENIFLKNLNFYQVYSLGDGGILLINIINNFTSENVYISNSSVSSYGIINFKSLKESSIHLLRNTTCLNNQAQSGSCIYFNSASFIEIIDINITGCLGTPLDFSYSLQISIIVEKYFIFNNYITSFILKTENVDAKIYFGVLSENNFLTTENSIFSFIKTNDTTVQSLKLFDKKYNFSSIPKLIIIFKIESSFIDFQDIFVNFEEPTANNFTILNAISNSKVKFEKSIFQKIFYPSSSIGLVQMENSLLEMNSCFSYINLGPFLVSTNSNITINSSVFQQDHSDSDLNPNDFLLETLNSQTYFHLLNCKIAGDYGKIMSLSNSLECILNFSHFIKLSQNSSNFYQGFDLKEIKKLLVLKSEFQRFSSENGACIKIQNSVSNGISEIYINESYFENSSSYVGGAIYIISDSLLRISHSQFDNNKAIFDLERKNGIAGVIFFESISEKKSLFVLYQNKFANNSADLAVQDIYSSECLTLDENILSQMSSNYERIRFFSFPLDVILANSNDLLAIKSGESLNISFILVDCHNQSLKFDSDTIGSLQAQSLNHTPISIKSKVSKSNEGVLDFDSLKVNSDPEILIELTITLNLLNTITKKLRKIQRSFNLKTTNCSLGEIILNDMSCYKCPYGTYSSNDFPTERPNLCLPCPLDATCHDGYLIIPNKGYWRRSKESRLIILCNVPENCFGFIQDKNLSQNPDTINITGACLKNQYGNLCDMCVANYGKYDQSSPCELCQSLQSSTVLRAIFILLFIIIFVIKSSSVSGKKDPDFILDVVFKILINHFQKLSIIVLGELQISTEDLKNYMKSFNFINIISSDVITNDCFLQNLFENQQKYTFYKTAINLFIPFILSLMCLLFFAFVVAKTYFSLKKVKRTQIQIISHLKILILKKSIVFFLVCSFLCYGMIITTFINLIDCVPLDDVTSQTFVANDPNFECWRGLHLQAAAPCAFIGLILWGFLFPSSLWRILKFSLNDSSSKYEEKKKKSLIFDERTFQFFYKDYRQEFYYWQCVIFVQKLFINVFAKLKRWTGLYQFQLLNLVFFLVYFYYIDKYSPYLNQKMNNLELFSTTTVFLTNLAIICLSSQLPASWTYFLYLVTALVNIIFLLFSIFIMIRYTKWKQLWSKAFSFISLTKSKQSRIMPDNSFFQKRESKIAKSTIKTRGVINFKHIIVK